MKALLDTNVFLEIILSQERAEEAKELLLKSAQHEFFITGLFTPLNRSFAVSQKAT